MHVEIDKTVDDLKPCFSGPLSLFRTPYGKLGILCFSPGVEIE